MHGNRHLGECGGQLAGAAALPRATAASAGRPRPGSRAARRHRSWPVFPRPTHRPGPGRPAGSQVTAAATAHSHPGGPGIPWREAGARHNLTPANQRRDRCLPGCPGRALRLSPHQISARPGAKQATRERAEPVLRKPESNGIKVCTKLASLRSMDLTSYSVRSPFEGRCWSLKYAVGTMAGAHQVLPSRSSRRLAWRSKVPGGLRW